MTMDKKKYWTNISVKGDNVMVREIVNGERITRIDKSFAPSLFVETQYGTPYKSLSGKNLKRVDFSCLFEYKTWKQKNRFNSIHGEIQNEYQYISENYALEQKITSDDLKIYCIDIEVSNELSGFPEAEHAKEEVLVISVYDFSSDKVTVFGSRVYNGDKTDFEYKKYHTEKELLQGFLDWWSKDYPDIVTGWNIKSFDIPYLINRVKRLFDVKEAYRFSPFDLLKTEKSKKLKYSKNFKEQTIYSIYGVEILDYLDLYQKYQPENRESYKLDFIAEEEIGANKLEYKYKTFKEFYTKNWNLYVEYNVHDVRLVKLLDDRLKYLDIQILLAHLSGVNYQDVYAQTRTWDSVIYNHLKKENVMIPPRVEAEKLGKYKGAFVKPIAEGFHNWVVGFDLNHPEPHLIVMLMQ